MCVTGAVDGSMTWWNNGDEEMMSTGSYIVGDEDELPKIWGDTPLGRRERTRNGEERKYDIYGRGKACGKWSWDTFTQLLTVNRKGLGLNGKPMMILKKSVIQNDHKKRLLMVDSYFRTS